MHDRHLGGMQFVGQVGVVLFYLVDHPPIQEVINGAAAQAVVALGGNHPKVTGGFRPQHRNIQGAATEVEHRHMRPGRDFLLGRIVHGCRPRLSDGAQHILGHPNAGGRPQQCVHVMHRPGFRVGDGDAGRGLAGMLGAALF